MRGTTAATTTACHFFIGISGDFVLAIDFFADEKKANSKNGGNNQRLPHNKMPGSIFRLTVSCS